MWNVADTCRHRSHTSTVICSWQAASITYAEDVICWANVQTPCNHTLCKLLGGSSEL